MIAMTQTAVPRNLTDVTTVVTPTFESLLPALQRCVGYAFRRVRRCLREDLIAEAIGRAYLAFLRLIQRGLTALIYPAALAKYAVRQVWDGRRVGSRRAASDVLSEHAQQYKSFRVERLNTRKSEPWHEQLLVDRRATPAELVACKLDFSAWLQQLTSFKRQVALRLAIGDTTSEVASQFCVTRGRISQLRRELRDSWEVFQAWPV